MKVKNTMYLYIALWGLVLAIALLVISAGISANNLTGVTFGIVLMLLGTFVPLAIFTGLVAKRLDVLAETGEDKPPLR